MKGVDFEGKGLSAFPSIEKDALRVKSINLSRNNLREIRESDLLKYVNLLDLWLDHNELTILTGIDKLYRLESLRLEHNTLTTLSGCIQELVKLESLSVSNNQITSLGRLDNLVNLRTLMVVLFWILCSRQPNNIAKRM
eukprot:TRINITY_DN4495_c0_g1_i16.p1 TRINITY_DN4495_c0_g1~~TRINITY_DN4495_c0_g1_i16.p1  ORF type:complete len:139 (-),score=10.06 TRINITY_DN4495_c0_g1_i16:338-754(-)